MNKRVSMILFIVAMLVLMMSACSDKGKERSAKQPDSSENIAQDPFGKYPKTVTVTQVLGFNPPETDDAPKGIVPDQNAYLKELKDMLNIEVKYLWTVPKDNFDQKFSMSIASGDLPDVMSVDPRMFERFKNQGILADLSDAFNNYASPMIKQYMESDGGFAMETLTSDGQLLGIPRFEDPYLSTQLIWIRTDWLNKLNMEPPKTIDDLERIAEAFIHNNPDGRDDVYGIALHKELIAGSFDARGFFYGFNAYPQGWIKGVDGKLVAGEIQPETKNALATLQSWYGKGILDKEFALKDENKVVEDIVAGKAGIVYGEWWYPAWPLNMNMDKDPNAEWEPYQIPSFDGSPGKSMVGKVRLDTIVVVNKKFANPEAAIKMINFYTELSNKEYLDKVQPKNGYISNWFDPRIYNPNDIENQYTEVNKALNAGQDKVDYDGPNSSGVEKVFNSSKAFLAGDMKGWGNYYSRAAEYGGWGLTRQIRDSNMVTFNEFYGTATETQMEKGAQLDKLQNETFSKIIMGSPLSDFDKFVESWKSLGGDDITNEINEWYENNTVK